MEQSAHSTNMVKEHINTQKQKYNRKIPVTIYYVI